MKKASGVIALIILLVAIFLGLGYKMIEPDGWDRFVEDLIPSRAENDHGDLNVKPDPTAEPAAEPTVAPAVAPTQAPDDDEDDEKPEATTAPTATPTVSPSATSAPTQAPADDGEKTEYEKYIELSGAEQQKIFESYTNPQDFFDWYNAAKKEYDDKNQAIIVDGGSINLEDYIGKDDGTAEQ